jgi:hypothetical protein
MTAMLASADPALGRFRLSGRKPGPTRLVKPLGQATVEMRILRPGHPLRAAAEAHIRAVYAHSYGASLGGFPTVLLAGMSGPSEIGVVAGLRTSSSGFFSESYLDQPIECVLSRSAGGAVERQRILEFTTLASASADLTVAFLRRVALLAEHWGFDWAFFTATRRLMELLTSLGLELVSLADADPSRIDEARRWGGYYGASPVVYAVARRRLALLGAPVAPERRHG